MNTSLPRHSYYQIGRTLTIEVYTKVPSVEVAQIDENALEVRLLNDRHVFRLAHPVELQNFSKTQHKVEINMTTDCKFDVLLQETKVIDVNTKYEKMEEAGLEDGISNDYMDRIRAVYYSSDDRTKEAMLKSYYESQGTVISSKWGCDEGDSEK